MSTRRLNIALLLTFLTASSFAAFSSEGLHAKANRLLVQAQKAAVYDSNANGAPFHEQVDFVFFGMVRGDEKGTFVRDWISQEQWRWKWELPDYQEIRVRSGKQIGECETPSSSPFVSNSWDGHLLHFL